MKHHARRYTTKRLCTHATVTLGSTLICHSCHSFYSLHTVSLHSSPYHIVSGDALRDCLRVVFFRHWLLNVIDERLHAAVIPHHNYHHVYYRLLPPLTVRWSSPPLTVRWSSWLIDTQSTSNLTPKDGDVCVYRWARHMSSWTFCWGEGRWISTRRAS